MSLRRMMLFSLGAKIKNLIEAFKARVFAAQGEFEAETCLNTQLTGLDNKGLLDSASFVLTPNAYEENILFAVKPDKVGTNLLRWSEDFTQTIWQKNGSATVTGNTVTAPDGTNTADTLQRTTTNGAVFQTGVSLTAGQTYTASIYLRADTNGTINIGMASGAVFLLRNITTSWQRYTFTFTQATTASDGLAIFLQASNTLSSVYAWGAQLELGSTATDYISTTDRAIINGTIGDLTVSRTSLGTRVNADGDIEQVPYNLLQQSEGFTQAAWVLLGSPNVTRTANAGTSPIGTNNATLLTSNSTSTFGIRQSVTISPNTQYVFSCWVRSDNPTEIRVDISDLNVTSFNLTNTWQRIQVLGTYNNSYAANLQFVDIVFGPNQLGSSFFIWGAQLELGSTAKDYFPTTNRFNIPRIDYSNGSCPSILVEQATSNQIRNNSMVGAVVGNPGTLPTNWSQSLGGLTRQVVGLGVEKGLQYVDVRISGTVTGTTFQRIRFEPSTQIVAANGQTWTLSTYLKSIAAPQPPTNYRLVMHECDSSGVFITVGAQVITPTTSFARYSFTRTLSGGATVARVQPILEFTTVSGETYDFTIRVSGPQMEQLPFATSLIQTSTAAVTRNADVISNTNARTLIGQTEGSIYVEFNNTPYVAAGGGFRWLLCIRDPSTNNFLKIYRNTSVIVVNRVGMEFHNGTFVLNLFSPSNTYDMPLGRNKVLVTYQNGLYKLFQNGALRATVSNSLTVPTNMSRIDVGSFVENVFANLNDGVYTAALWKTTLTDAQAIQLTTL